MQLSTTVIIRGFSTCSALLGKRNFRKFILPRRGSNVFKERQKTNPVPGIPVFTYGVREVGYKDGENYVVVPECIPELIVPDLADCKLKPYVSYRAPDVTQSEFRPEDLFEVVYCPKIKKDFESDQLDANGNPLQPSDEERLTPQEAWNQARRTGSDIFVERSKREEEEKYDL